MIKYKTFLYIKHLNLTEFKKKFLLKVLVKTITGVNYRKLQLKMNFVLYDRNSSVYVSEKEENDFKIFLNVL